MATIRCDKVNPICWAWIGEYGRRRKLERCKALERIIEEHMKFIALAHYEKVKRAPNVHKAKKK